MRGAADGSAALAPDAGAESATSGGDGLGAPATRQPLGISDAPPARSARSTKQHLHFFFLSTGLPLHHHQGGVSEQGQRHVYVIRNRSGANYSRITYIIRTETERSEGAFRIIAV